MAPQHWQSACQAGRGRGARLALPECSHHLCYCLAPGMAQAQRSYARMLRNGRRAGRALALDGRCALGVGEGRRQVPQPPPCALAREACC